MTGAPAITVLMAVHDGARWLGEAIDSVLAQDFTDFEFVIVDDASADATPEILARAAARDGRVHLLCLPANVGLTRALNHGLGHATGRWIARIDADDRCRPDRLSCQLARMKADPALAILGSGYRLIDGQGRSLGTLSEGLDDWQARWLSGFSTPAPHPSFFFARLMPDGSAVRYDERFATAQDFDLWSRLSRAGGARVLPDPLIDYRRHEGAITVRRRREQAAVCAGIATANLARRLPPGLVAALGPLTALLAHRAVADRATIRATVAGADALLAHDMAQARTRAERRWLRRMMAALLADAVLSRGGALARPRDLAQFLLCARHHLVPLADAVRRRPVTARKALRALLAPPPTPGHDR